MPVAGLTVLSRYWKDATKHRGDVRKAENTEAVHDMRVAIRRLRVAVSLFGPWYGKDELRGIRRELRRLARRLGAVRDGEVLLQTARAATQLPDADLAGLLTRWEADYAVGRVRLLDYLDGTGFRRFTSRLEEFLDRPDAGQCEGADRRGRRVSAGRVCDVMPAEVWTRFGTLHAYEDRVADATLSQVHRLRIAGKRLRYAIEPFEELLGADGSSAVGLLKELQDALGSVHDAAVAIELLETFQATRAGPSDHVEPYIEQQRSVLTAARARFEILWPSVTGRGFREHIAGCALTLAGPSAPL